jgi:hypothetical protein
MPTRRGPVRRSRGRWSARATRESRALVLEEGVFTWDDPARIARSLRRSAEASTVRKAAPFASAMSMLCFFVNRAGRTLAPRRRRVLERAKQELRREFGRVPPSRPSARARRAVHPPQQARGG